MKETTEQFGEVLVNSIKDISLAYPELFIKLHVDSSPFLIEKKFEKVDYSQEPRLILNPSGIVAVSCPKDNEYVWEDYNKEEYRKLLEETNTMINITNKENSDDLVKQKNVNGKMITIKCFPYNNVKASTNLVKLAEDKMQKYIHSLI